VKHVANNIVIFNLLPEWFIQDDDYAYEDDGEKVNLEHAVEEDPEVLKELIKLIKKVGGIEELEKQLNIQDGEVSLKASKTQSASTTPSTISKDLYERVLNKASGGQFLTKNRFSSSFSGKTSEKDSAKPDTKYSPVVRNNRPDAQNSGLDKLPDFDLILKEKPKYTTITRQRPESTTADTSDESIKKDSTDSENEKFDNYEYEDDVVVKAKTTTQSPQYVNIRRQRPSTTIATTTSTTTPQTSSEEDYEYEIDEEAIKSTTTIKTTTQKKTSNPRRSTTVKPTESNIEVEATTSNNR
jgi:chitinase